MATGDDAVRSLDLGEGLRLVVRPAVAGDASAVVDLYERLSADDRRLRFFSVRPPSPDFVEKWVTSAQRGGLDLVVEVDDGEATTLVAEAGYALLPNGDGELGITVDPRWRGWLGPWLLDVLAAEAAGRGVPNLEADVLVRNRGMLSMARRRGVAMVDHPDWEVVRVVFSTTGRTPGWPPEPTGPRLLVTAPGGHWSGEKEAEARGFDVRTCPGPEGRSSECPVLAGGTCPLVEGADAIVVALRPDDPRTEQLLGEYRRQHPELVVTVPVVGGGEHRPPCERAAAVLDSIESALDRDRPADDAS